jgi:hypothetical protein
MSPKWVRGTKGEALEIAEKIAARIQALRDHPAHWLGEIRLDARYAEIELRDQPTSDGGRTCSRAELGESAAFGACDHPTSDKSGPPLPLPPSQLCQAPKLTPLGELEWLAAGGARSFPHLVPIGLVRIDDSYVAEVPAEVTIGAGRVLRSAIKAAAPEAGHVFLSGLTNGYILYVASEPEYGWQGKGGGCTEAVDVRVRQSYEGASTLYGPKTARLFADRLAALAGSMQGKDVPGVDGAAPSPYDTGPVRARLALPTSPPRPWPRWSISTCRLDPEPPPNERYAHPIVCFLWRDGPVGDFLAAEAPWIQLVPVAGAALPPDLVIDDRGFDFVTRAHSADAESSRWSTLWHATDAEATALGAATMAIEVGGVGGAPALTSRPFDASGARLPKCNDDEVRACGAYDDPVPDFPYPPNRK